LSCEHSGLDLWKPQTRKDKENSDILPATSMYHSLLHYALYFPNKWLRRVRRNSAFCGVAQQVAAWASGCGVAQQVAAWLIGVRRGSAGRGMAHQSATEFRGLSEAPQVVAAWLIRAA
jgi:hypothetical protein